MDVSQARIEANRRNAMRSTGPRTPEGRERSRANSLKHGLTGAGLVLPAEDQAEVERRALAFAADLRPANEVALALVHHAALLSVRLERCGRNEIAAVARRVRHAEAIEADARREEADDLIDRLEIEPGRSLRRLKRTPEGCDRLIALWSDLRSDLGRWTPAHLTRAEALTGRRAGDFGTSPIARLARALAEAPGDALALAAFRGRIDAEQGDLVAARDAIDREELVEGAADRVLFDPSAEATLARRYEAAASRGFFRCLKDVARINLECKDAPQAPPAPAPMPAPPLREVASFCPAPVPPPDEPESEPEPVAEPVAEAPTPPTSPRRERREQQAESRREARRRKLERRRS